MATASCSSYVSTASTVTNYARLGLATHNELPNILRKLLLIKEPPHLLEAHLNNNGYLSRNLKEHEKKIIRTVRTSQYNEFDVPLMYKIIRNLNLVPSPTQGWANETPPLATEITVGDDIERIRRIRNEIVHRGNSNVQDLELSNYFSIFKDLASRLEVTLMLSNREFVSKIENVETCCIDNDAQQLYIRRLKELAENETQLTKSVAKVQKDVVFLGLKITSNFSKLQEEVDEIKIEQMKVIPKNIRVEQRDFKEINGVMCTQPVARMDVFFHGFDNSLPGTRVGLFCSKYEQLLYVSRTFDDPVYKIRRQHLTKDAKRYCYFLL